MKKLIAVATIAMAGLTIGGTAFAGENTGGPNPKPTPINNFGHAQAIWAFSGQNDNPDGAVILPDAASHRSIGDREGAELGSHSGQRQGRVRRGAVRRLQGPTRAGNDVQRGIGIVAVVTGG